MLGPWLPSVFNHNSVITIYLNSSPACDVLSAVYRKKQFKIRPSLAICAIQVARLAL